MKSFIGDGDFIPLVIDQSFLFLPSAIETNDAPTAAILKKSGMPRSHCALTNLSSTWWSAVPSTIELYCQLKELTHQRHFLFQRLLLLYHIKTGVKLEPCRPIWPFSQQNLLPAWQIRTTDNESSSRTDRNPQCARLIKEKR